MPVRKNNVPVAHPTRLDGGYRGAVLVNAGSDLSRSNSKNANRRRVSMRLTARRAPVDAIEGTALRIHSHDGQKPLRRRQSHIIQSPGQRR